MQHVEQQLNSMGVQGKQLGVLNSVRTPQTIVQSSLNNTYTLRGYWGDNVGALKVVWQNTHPVSTSMQPKICVERFIINRSACNKVCKHAHLEMLHKRINNIVVERLLGTHVLRTVV